MFVIASKREVSLCVSHKERQLISMAVVSSFVGTHGDEDALKLPNLENIHSRDDVVIQLPQGWTIIYYILSRIC